MSAAEISFYDELSRIRKRHERHFPLSQLKYIKFKTKEDGQELVFLPGCNLDTVITEEIRFAWKITLGHELLLKSGRVPRRTKQR
ncbi:MAG: hypothetical protein JWQ27_2684 [Ferruginibacter sp.]|nr:hypothetical protein [Ferruginibacter sp.]